VKPTGEYRFLTLPVDQFIGREEIDLLPLDAMGLLTRCIFRAWRKGSVPAASADLARLVGSTQKKIEKLLPLISEFFIEEDARLIFPIIEAQRERVTKMVADKTHAGTVSAQKRLLRKTKREENASKRKALKDLNSRSTGVATVVGEIEREREIEISGNTDPEKAPLPSPKPASLKSPNAGAVDSAMRSLGIGDEPGNGHIEEYARGMFYDLWPNGPYAWTAEKISLISAIRKYKRGSFNVAQSIWKEHKREGKRMGNELAYLVGIAREDWSNRKKGNL